MITKSRELLDKAAELYPIGTQFIALFSGAKDVIAEPKEYPFAKFKFPIYRFDSYGCIIATTKLTSRIIYQNGSWAEIIK